MRWFIYLLAMVALIVGFYVDLGEAYSIVFILCGTVCIVIDLIFPTKM